MGLQILLDEPEPVELWPDNLAAFEVFDALGTQWSVAPNGRLVGLRYEAVAFVMRLCGVAAADRRQVFEDLRVMENAVLTLINSKR
jgi:hypothetical protein